MAPATSFTVARMRLALLLLVACGATPAAPAVVQPSHMAPESTTAADELRAAKFDAAARDASRALEHDPHDSRAAAVRAIANYQAAGNELYLKLAGVIDRAEHFTAFDHEDGRAAWRAFAERLDSIDADLAIVGADPSFSLELCMACWEHDWNHHGGIDDRDRRLFELEYDGKGGRYEEGDPRRRPTFRFDVGDAEWARAMIAFQHAAVELVLAYRWSDLDKLLYKGDPTLTIRLFDRSRVAHARALILDGLAHADSCRALYLAETDDDREWVPSPRQKSHPIPLEVDDALFATWGAITGDVRRLLTSEEGLSIREIAQLVDRRAALLAPDAYVDVGRMLREPTNFSIDLKNASATPAGVETTLRNLLGNGYATAMKPSPLPGRLMGMMKTLESGGETFEHKLRYLFWLN